MKLYTSPAGMACPACGFFVFIHEDRTCWIHGSVRAECSYHRCENYQRIFEFTMLSIEAKFIEEPKE
jgi:hypothetical protein